MNDHAVVGTIARLFQGSPSWAYSLRPDMLRLVSTNTLTMLSDALEAGWLRELYLPDEGIVELRLTRLGRRSLSSYKRWKENHGVS